MGLLSDHVYLNITGNIAEYYENLGYSIPKKIDKNGKIKLDKSTLVKVNIKDLMKGSSKKVKFECDNCKDVFEYTYKNYNDRLIKGKRYCYRCHRALFKSGENSYAWNPNLSKEDRLKRSRKSASYNDFIRKVLDRDEYCCQLCKSKERKILEVHHLDGYSWCKEKRESVENGISLCKNCHGNFHLIYGKGLNTKKQFEEWVGSSIELKDSGHSIIPTKKIYCIEENKIYDSCSEFAQKHNLKSESYVYKLCNHVGSVEKKTNNLGETINYHKKAFTVKGLHVLWYDEYLKMDEEKLSKFLKETNSPIKKVICLTTNEIFENIKIASESYNCNEGGISNCCKGKYKTSGQLDNKTSLSWMFYDDFMLLSKSKQIDLLNNNKKIKGKTSKRAVLCINTGEIFESTHKAGDVYKMSPSGISACCRGELSYYGKEKNTKIPILWKYLD